MKPATYWFALVTVVLAIVPAIADENARDANKYAVLRLLSEY